MSKNIEIIPLAYRKAKKRGISEKMIIEAVKNPEQVVDGYEGRKVAHKYYMIYKKKYLLRVVYELYEKKCVVITAYMTSQIQRYWEEKNED